MFVFANPNIVWSQQPTNKIFDVPQFITTRQVSEGIQRIPTITLETTAEWLDVLDELVATVESRFCDPEKLAGTWRRKLIELRQSNLNAWDRDRFASEINQLLKTLETSHTYLYTLDDPELYELIGVFSQVPAIRSEHERWLALNGIPQMSFAGIGLRCQLDGDAWVTQAVLPNSPAARAGLAIGDRILSVEGKPFHPYRSFEERTGQVVQVQWKRLDQPMESSIVVQTYDPLTMFHDAIDQSVEVILIDGHSIGLVRMWSYAGRAYHDRLATHILEGDLASCDSLIVDLRGGWGGASPSFLSLFDRTIPKIEMISPNGDRSTFPSTWSKPVTFLVDSTVRSGKEAFVYGFKKQGRGEVIGQATGGAVSAGTLIHLPNGCALYLAVAQCEVDGERLEGIGVQPTIVVDWNWKQCGGVDMIREEALRRAAAQLSLPSNR